MHILYLPNYIRSIFGSVCPIRHKLGKVLEKELREQLEDLLWLFQRKSSNLFEICCCVWVSVLSLTISASRAKNSDNYVSIEMLSLSSNKVLTTVNALLADIRYLHCPPLSLCNCILFICCAVLPWWPLPLTWLNHPRNEDLKQHSLTHLVQIVTGLV